MLTLSLTTWLIIIGVAAILSFLVYQVFLKNYDELEDSSGESLVDEDDVNYGAFLEVDSIFLYENGIQQDSTIQVSLPMTSTPEGYVRAEINNSSFIDIPVKKITAVHNSVEDTKAYKEKAKHVYEGNKKSETTKDQSTTISSDGVTLGLFAGELSSGPDKYSGPSEQSEIKSNGNGGEFAGGGASGNWDRVFSDSEANREARGVSEYHNTNHHSNYSPSHDTTSYSSHDSSSHSSDSSSSHDSGSSSYDSGSSDTSSSSGGDSW